MLKRSFLFGFLVVAFFVHCASTKQQGVSKDDVQIFSATSRKYSGGIKGAPSGTKYRLLLISPGNQDEFRTIGCWMNNQYFEVQAFKNNLGINKLKYNAGDTLTVSFNVVNNPELNLNEVSSKKPLQPQNRNEKIVLLYTYKNQQKYSGFNSITELEPELRP